MLHNNTQLRKWLTIFSLFLLLILSSCGAKKNLSYFRDIQKDSVTWSSVKPVEVIIRSGDILNIRVSSSDELTIARINGVSATPAAAGGSSGMSAGSAAPGYLVNDSGNITLPLLGKIRAAGLTKDGLAKSIQDGLISKKFVLDAIVNVRITNFRVTVLGEVNRPGVISVPEERITLTDAISTAGDLTLYGNRSNILIIRYDNGKRTYKRIDLTKNDIFNSSYYYLENQDIIYIEPIKHKSKSLNNSTQIYTLALSTISILTLLYTQIVK